MTAVRLTMLVCAAGLAAFAQIPGQYPPGYPGGGYPGQYPPGGGYPGQYPPGQIPGQYPPNGRTNPQGRGNDGPPTLSRGRNNQSSVPATTYGMLRAATATQFVLEPDDHRLITYRFSSKTAVQKDAKDVDLSSFAIGDHLIVDSTEDDDGYFTAVSVKFDSPGTAADRAAASETWDLPKLEGKTTTDGRPVLRRGNGNDSSAQEPGAIADNRPATTMRPPDAPPDAGDPGPPTLRRGAPPEERPAPLPPPPQVSGGDSSSTPVILTKAPEPPSILSAPHDDPVVAKAREAAARFAGTLPDFFCQQVTTRYESDHPKTGWDALDIVTADVAYSNGEETYKNIKIGNRPTNKPMGEIQGNSSTGEFATILEGLLDPATEAVFHPDGTDTIHGHATYIYKFDVPRERSRWHIQTAAQLYFPAYSGSMWIDKETSRVLRIEMQARNLPLLFPLDTVETATDYDFVRLSTPQEFLLPVDAEVLSCQRGTSMCARNRIEFRNYRKFGADSSVTFETKP